MADTENIYEKNENGDEEYPFENGIVKYEMVGDRQIYAKLKNDDEFAAKDVNGNEFYAYSIKGGDRVEYLPRDRNNKTKFILNADGTFKYPMNLSTGQPADYEKDAAGNEIYLTSGEKEIYRVVNEKEFPAKDFQGIQKYAKDNGEPYYPKNEIGNEVYIRIGNTDLQIPNRYARLYGGNEHYPKIWIARN